MSAGANDVEVVRVAERALLVRFLDAGLGRAVARAHRLRERLEEEGFGEAEEVALGAGSLLCRLSPDVGEGGVESRKERLRDLARTAEPAPAAVGRPALRSIAVGFGGDDGIDLGEVAQRTGLAEREVVARLCAAELVVAFVGFSPGFPYLIGLPPELELPRRSTPRPRVPDGSVAIAGPFAGIYPSATPGGWHLVGRTGARLFDPEAASPAVLGPGDRIRFRAR